MVDADVKATETAPRSVVHDVDDEVPADELMMDSPSPAAAAFEADFSDDVPFKEVTVDGMTANDQAAAEDANDQKKEEVSTLGDATVEAKKETAKLKMLMAFSGAKKSLKKNIKTLKKKAKAKTSKKKSSDEETGMDGADDDAAAAAAAGDRNLKQLDSADPAAQNETDTEDEVEREDERNTLRENLRRVEQDNVNLREMISDLKAVHQDRSDEPFDEVPEDLDTEERKRLLELRMKDEKIVTLHSQVDKWQKLYLESSNIFPDRIERLEVAMDAETEAGGRDSTRDEKKDANEDRILMLEYQLRESVKVLKAAQKKMVGQHEKEFHLQKTVDDLTDQIMDLNTKLENSSVENSALLNELEKERTQRLEAINSLKTERQRLDDFREDLGMEPIYKNKDITAIHTNNKTAPPSSSSVVVEETLDDQIQKEQNSSFFCCASQKTLTQ